MPSEDGFRAPAKPTPFVPAWLDELGLDPYSFRVYAHICRRAGSGSYWEGARKAADACNISHAQYRRSLARLCDVGLLEVASAEAGKRVVYLVLTPVAEGALPEQGDPTEQGGGALPEQGQSRIKGTKVPRTEGAKTTKEQLSLVESHARARAASLNAEPAARLGQAVQAAFDYWRERTGQGPRTLLTPDRRRALLVRLKEELQAGAPDFLQASEGLKLAVDGALCNPYFNGSKDGQAHLGFENIFVHKGRNRIETLQRSAASKRPAGGAASGYIQSLMAKHRRRREDPEDLVDLGCGPMPSRPEPGKSYGLPTDDDF